MYHLVQYTTIQYLSQLFLNKAILQLPKCTFIASALKHTELPRAIYTSSTQLSTEVVWKMETVQFLNQSGWE